MEADTYLIRGFGYLVVATVVIDLVASGLVLMLRDSWEHWLFAATLLASISALAIATWAFTALWHLARSRFRRA